MAKSYDVIRSSIEAHKTVPEFHTRMSNLTNVQRVNWISNEKKICLRDKNQMITGMLCIQGMLSHAIKTKSTICLLKLCMYIYLHVTKYFRILNNKPPKNSLWQLYSIANMSIKQLSMPTLNHPKITFQIVTIQLQSWSFSHSKDFYQVSCWISI